MLMGLRWAFNLLPAAPDPFLYMYLMEPGSQAIQVNCPMNEGCTGECEEKNSGCPFHSYILQIFIEYLLSAGAWQERLGKMVSRTRQGQSWRGEGH